MESLSQILEKTLPNSHPLRMGAGTMFDFMAAQQKKAELINKSKGTLEGYDCPDCLNRGYFMRVDDGGRMLSKPCKCQAIRSAMSAMDRSGIPKETLVDCTWDAWKTPEPWQKKAISAAKAYTKHVLNGGSFFFVISGVPGSGKTKLCTTIFRAVVEGGKRGMYLSWRDFARRAKSVAADYDEFENMIVPPRKAEFLYLDDFWKGTVTPADINLAFELIDPRYSARKPTIISSEMTIEEIIQADEAVGSRLFEMTNGYYLDCSMAKNWRTNYEK